MISVEYSEAIVEVLDILYNSDDAIIEKIPRKLLEFWNRNKSNTYKPNLDHSKSINEMNLKDKTKSIITMIYLNYLCDNEEKDNLNLILKQNEENYQQKLREKYNSDNIFKNKNVQKDVEEQVQNSTLSMREYKEGIIKRIINKIQKIFHIK